MPDFVECTVCRASGYAMDAATAERKCPNAACPFKVRPAETRFQRIAREQTERQIARAARMATQGRGRGTGRGAAKRRAERRASEAAELEADYMPDSFDGPERPEF